MIQLHLLTTAIIEFAATSTTGLGNGLRFLFKNVQEYHRISQGILGYFGPIAVEGVLLQIRQYCSGATIVLR